MTTKLNPSIFRKAAKIVENNEWEFGCHAIIKASSTNGEFTLKAEDKAKPYIDFLYAVFLENNTYVIWSRADLGNLTPHARTFGLYLCAELVSSGFTTNDFTTP